MYTHEYKHYEQQNIPESSESTRSQAHSKRSRSDKNGVHRVVSPINVAGVAAPLDVDAAATGVTVPPEPSVEKEWVAVPPVISDVGLLLEPRLALELWSLSEPEAADTADATMTRVTSHFEPLDPALESAEPPAPLTIAAPIPAD